MTGIGVTGHRQLPDIHLAASQVDAVLGKIRSRFNAPYTLYSSLAEGADRLAARRALEILDARLVVPLPFKKEDLLESCTQDSRLALLELLALAQQVIEMPSTPTLEEAYQSAGHFILDRVDVLIALWDGRPARGLGGTGQVVAEARARGLPLAWIHARNHIPGDGIPSFLGLAAGNVTFENFPRLPRKTG